jgi:uncharacterized protein YndB with AHSA1/START domain
MSETRFVYVTYIRTTPLKLWRALLDPEFTRQYWFETRHDCEWVAGSPWRLIIPDGRAAHTGEVLEILPERRLVLSWRAEFDSEMHAEGYSRVTFELEPKEEAVKLTVIHEIGHSGSKLVGTLSVGWPQLLSSLKSLLETGTSLEDTRHWPKHL